jgi:DNA (cytosine-5)-methyltransferase 1
MQQQSSTSTGPTCPSTTTCARSHQHTHTHTQDFSVDLICGGFPCQDISVAGKGAGLAGERSGLWNDFARIIRTVRPRWVVIKNVPALTARGLGTVLGDLAEIGFDAEWHCIPASAVGAPHRRERIWIVAYSVSQRQTVRRHCEDVQGKVHCGSRNASGSKCDCGQGCTGCTGQGSCDVSDADSHGASQRRTDERMGGQSRSGKIAPNGAGWIADVSGSQWKAEPDVGRVAHGVPCRVDRLRCLGNAVVPQVVKVIGRAILDAEARMNA